MYSRRLSFEQSPGVVAGRRASVDISAGVDNYTRRPSVDFGNLGLPVNINSNSSDELRSPTSRRSSVDLSAGVGPTVKRYIRTLFDFCVTCPSIS